MTMREGGTTFEAVRVPERSEEAELIEKLQARNGGLPTFERRLSTKADFELGKNAWNASSRIWGTSMSFLDGAVEDAPMRRRLQTVDIRIFINFCLASPVREGSLSSYGHIKTTTTSTRTPNDVNDENATKSKMPWGPASASIGFSSRQKSQPLSPTQQRQNQNRNFVANGSSGTHDHSSLFAGSDPDMDDTTLHIQPSQSHRRVLATGSRGHSSPTRAMTLGSGQLDQQVQAFNLNRYHADNGFTSVQEFEDEPALFQQLNEHLDVLPLHNGPDASTLANGVFPETLYRSDYRSATNERAHGRPFNADHTDPHRPFMHQDDDNAIRVLERMTLDETTAAFVPQCMPLNQPHFQRDVSHISTRSGSINNRFQVVPAQMQGLGPRLNPQAPQYGVHQYAGRSTQPSLSNDYRSSLNSPYYSATGTPPTGPQSIRSTPGSGVSSRTSHHDPFIFERKLPGVDQYGIDLSMFAPNPLQQSMTSNFQYDVQTPSQPLRMNPLAHPYVAHGHAPMHNYPSGPRVPVREPEQAHIVRSPLLEEFRLNSKHNRRYELKDIYSYVVEFSGDQHGSRFIQQKLETANSDEKEQIFKELQPNLLQLMTDVFGNYVIQKMFEHGNQTQKKHMAHHMKGHVLTLSMQMYGCRVVQKAFEHVLDDQQASLVKELDGPNLQVLKVVKDQNGNHVVQKAIERIPGEHVQFIIDAHRGQMAKISTHQYGCRVVQRMLEHCQPQAKRVILDELLEHIHPLISDSYGNYVVQHIIQNGEPRDRRQVVNIILHQLLVFSKHKFASNIVEKSIDCADEDQREQILRGLTAADEQGVTPVLGLMRDQYGNYVLRESPCPFGC